MSPPVGATGIQTCNDPGGGGDAPTPFRRFRVGAAYGAFSSTLKLGGIPPFPFTPWWNATDFSLPHRS